MATFLKEEERRRLLDRYLDIEWRDDVTALRCVLCHRVAISHFVSNCKHIFCNDCKTLCCDSRRQWQCPQCKNDITQLEYQDFDVEVNIHKLRICCPNHKYGCEYADQLRKIPAHLMTCEDTRQASTLMMESLFKSIVGELRERSRQLKSTFEEKFNELENKTDNMDTQFNDLTKKLTNDKVNLVPKKFKEEIQSMRTALESVTQTIQQNESHLQQTMEPILLNMEEMTTKTASMGKKIVKPPHKRPKKLNPMKTETCELMIKDVDNLRKGYGSVKTKVFKFEGYEYDIRAKIEKSKEKLKIRLQFKDGYNINQFLDRRVFTNVKYIVCDQITTQKKDIIRERNTSFSEASSIYNGRHSWIFARELPAEILAPPYTKDNCLKVKMVFEPPSTDYSFVSNNGVLVWRVDNYEQRKQDAFYSPIWSHSFYTSPQGYRVRIQLRFNAAQSLEAWVHFLTGDHDDTLTENFNHLTTVTLFHQSRCSDNFEVANRSENAKLSQIALTDDGNFIENDSILLKVVIQPTVGK